MEEVEVFSPGKSFRSDDNEHINVSLWKWVNIPLPGISGSFAYCLVVQKIKHSWWEVQDWTGNRKQTIKKAWASPLRASIWFRYLELTVTQCFPRHHLIQLIYLIVLQGIEDDCCLDPTAKFQWLCQLVQRMRAQMWKNLPLDPEILIVGVILSHCCFHL